MPVTTHKYAKEKLTVIWKPELCIHSGICAKGLPQVFNPRRRPWIELIHEEAEAIKAQIKKCPSGALSFEEKAD